MFRNAKNILQQGISEAGSGLEGVAAGGPAITAGGVVIGFFLGLGIGATFNLSLAAGLACMAASVIATPVALMLGCCAIAGAVGFLAGAAGALGTTLSRGQEPAVQAPVPQPSLMQQLEALSPEDSAKALTTLQNKAGKAFISAQAEAEQRVLFPAATAPAVAPKA